MTQIDAWQNLHILSRKNDLNEILTASVRHLDFCIKSKQQPQKNCEVVELFSLISHLSWFHLMEEEPCGISYPVWHHDQLLCFTDGAWLQFAQDHSAHVLMRQIHEECYRAGERRAMCLH